MPLPSGNNMESNIAQPTKVTLSSKITIFTYHNHSLPKIYRSYRQWYSLKPGHPHQQPTPQHHQRSSTCNISNKEQGMPTPPRVESLAHTATTPLEVVQLFLNLPCSAQSKLLHTFAGKSKPIQARQTYHHESSKNRNKGNTPIPTSTGRGKARPADYEYKQELEPTRCGYTRASLTWRRTYPRQSRSSKQTRTQVR